MPFLYRNLAAAATTLTLLWVTPPVLAHSAANLDLRCQVHGSDVDGFMAVNLHDLRHLVTLHGGDDGRLTEADVVAVRGAVERELQAGLLLDALPGEARCPATLVGFRLLDFSSVEVHVRFRCPNAATSYALTSGLFGGTGYSYDLHVEFMQGAARQELHLDGRHNHGRVELGPPRPWALLVGLATLVFSGLVAAVVAWRRHAKERRA